MASSASTGTLTSSWKKAPILSAPLKTKMGSALTTSAGQRKIDKYNTSVLTLWTISISGSSVVYFMSYRNPDGEQMPWCFYRRGRRLLWDYCDVTPCPEPTSQL